MTTRADQVRDILVSTSAISSLLTGGIYTIRLTNFTGISRDTTPQAFDANGYLKPCAFVGEGDVTVEPQVMMEMGADSGDIAFCLSRPIIIYVYTNRDYATLDDVCTKIVRRLVGYTLSGAYPLELVQMGLRELEQILGIANSSRATIIFRVREAFVDQKIV